MGRQIATFLTHRDTDRLIAKLQVLEGFYIVHSRSPMNRPTIVESVTIQQDDRLWLYYFLVRNDDVNSIVMREVPAQNYWVVDSLRSPVVEFTRSFLDDHQIRAGRLWYEKEYFGNKDQLVQKPHSFLTWADKIFKCARQDLKKTGNYLAGSEALELITSGKLRTIT